MQIDLGPVKSYSFIYQGNFTELLDFRGEGNSRLSNMTVCILHAVEFHSVISAKLFPAR